VKKKSTKMAEVIRSDCTCKRICKSTFYQRFSQRSRTVFQQEPQWWTLPASQHAPCPVHRHMHVLSQDRQRKMKKDFLQINTSLICIY